jgi:hypothetical protein
MIVAARLLTLAEVQAVTGKAVALRPEHWALARLLAAARQATNEGRTAASSDRGAAGNLDAHTFGAIAELFLLRHAMRMRAGVTVAYMRAHMLHPSGGGSVTGPDLQAADAEHVVGIDAKAFRSPNGFFAINARKHDAMRGSCAFYFGAAARRYGVRLITARLIPYDDVTAWERRSLRPGGSPSHNLPIAAFERTYAAPWRFAGLAGAYPERAVQQACDEACVRQGLAAMLGWMEDHP